MLIIYPLAGPLSPIHRAGPCVIQNNGFSILWESQSRDSMLPARSAPSSAISGGGEHHRMLCGRKNRWENAAQENPWC